MKILQTQLALFYVAQDNRPDKLISKINLALDDIFDQMPMILPVPDDAPPEIPSVIMKSTNELYQCNIARNRVDFLVRSTTQNAHTSDFLDSFINKIQAFCAVIFSDREIQRFGLVGHYFFETQDPGKKIQALYLKKNLDDLEELSVRYNKKSKKNGLMLNDIVEISMAKSLDQRGMEQSGVFIQRDINNVPSEKKLYLDDVIETFRNVRGKFELNGVMELIK